MRLLTAAREGVAAFRRVWAAAAIEDQRARAQRIRLAGSTDAELRRWGGAACRDELRRRGMG